MNKFDINDRVAIYARRRYTGTVKEVQGEGEILVELDNSNSTLTVHTNQCRLLMRCPYCNNEMTSGSCVNQSFHNKPQPICATCPVCLGNGLVANGFYKQIGGTWETTGTQPETCRSCKGTGVVWK
jgi:hypothetical protein